MIGGVDAVQIGEHVAELARDVDHQALRQRSAARGDLLLEIAPLDILHHQVMAILVVEAIGDRGNRLMLELRERVGLAREIFVGLDTLLLVDEVIDHLLDRAGAIGQALIAREVDHPHAAAAEQALDQRSVSARTVPGSSGPSGAGGRCAVSRHLARQTPPPPRCCRFRRRHWLRRSVRARPSYGIVVAAQNLGDRRILDVRRQPVAAQQQAVAALELAAQSLSAPAGPLWRAPSERVITFLCS